MVLLDGEIDNVCKWIDAGICENVNSARRERNARWSAAAVAVIMVDREGKTENG